MKRNKIAILGAGESGVGSAILAKKKGMEVFVSDIGKIKDKYKNVLLNHEIRFEEGKHSDSLIMDAAEVIKSPGIPDNIPIIESIKKEGINIISELEFADRFTRAKKICITGSNGKTTTALLTHHILKKAGINAGLAGNVGKSFALQVANENYDYYVLEVSSFQLDGMFNFKAEIAILLNITPDHLDRYDYDFGKYKNSKFRIINNQTEKDAFIYNYDDEVIREEIKKRKIKAKEYPFSQMTKLEYGGILNKNKIVINLKSGKHIMTLEELALQGKHNVYNSMAASIAARVLDIRKNKVKDSLADFQNIEHRLEYVATIHGVDYINDSKATNINSTWYALECMDKPIIWIAGGIDKGNDYSLIKEQVKLKVKAIVCLGVENELIHRAFKDIVSTIVNTTSAQKAVSEASKLSEHGDVVLLSPACASFDLFNNYEDRGNQFKQAVNDL